MTRLWNDPFTSTLILFSRAVHGRLSDRADDGSLAATLRPNGGSDGAQLGGTAIGSRYRPLPAQFISHQFSPARAVHAFRHICLVGSLHQAVCCTCGAAPRPAVLGRWTSACAAFLARASLSAGAVAASSGAWSLRHMDAICTWSRLLAARRLAA